MTGFIIEAVWNPTGRKMGHKDGNVKLRSIHRIKLRKKVESSKG